MKVPDSLFLYGVSGHSVRLLCLEKAAKETNSVHSFIFTSWQSEKLCARPRRCIRTTEVAVR